jgi:hypothetical protein
VAPVLLSGLSSVSDRTLFTHRAPIVKKPLALLTGIDLVIMSPTYVKITSANFTSDDIGKTLSIIGSSGGRNDGEFAIVGTPNSVTAELGKANFDIISASATALMIVALANDIRAMYEKHRVHKDVRIPPPSTTHDNDDTTNSIVAPSASDLSTAIALLNDLRTKFSNHILNVGGDFHTNLDVWNPLVAVESSGLFSAVTLANELRTKFNAHRLERRSHLLGDADSRISAPRAVMVPESVPGSLVGPFTWTLYDPRRGMVADSPDDVVVRINGSPVDAEAVFGMFGAVVLPSKPAPADSVVIDYDYLNNPPARFLRLNSPEFVLNQDKNHGIMGLPSHRYRARSYLIDPGRTPDLISAVEPLRIGWKYKAYERLYSATTNDPEKLLLNSPYKEIKYPVLRTSVKEVTIAYDPTTLPQDAVDPWKLEGEGEFILENGLLTVIDNDLQTSIGSKPPFFTHATDIIADSTISAAFRMRVDMYEPDGVFTGVGFGISDGFDVVLAGFIITEATNLTSAIATANDVKAKFNAHLVQPTVHGAEDQADAVEIVDAKDLTSLIILLNALKLRYGRHIVKADPTMVTVGIHKNIDTLDVLLSADAKDLNTSLVLANELRTKFNAHRTSIDVHFTDDVMNEVLLTMQIGILTNDGAYEFQDSWEAGAVDWTVLRTFRVYRDPSGDAQLYMSGDVSPLVSVSRSRLPSISDFGGKFDPVQQIFFGSISREATSTSTWNLIRANINPVSSNLLEDNKSVSFDGSTTPESDAVSPWITIGHGGTERVYTGGGLQVDSTCSAHPSEIVAMGASSGAFRGFLRFEPMLASTTTCTVEFYGSIDYHTFSLGNRSDGLFIDDGQLSVHFAFLYFSPSPAQVIGASIVYSLGASDKLFLSFDGAAAVTVVFPPATTTVAAVIAAVNAAVGVPVASNGGLNRVKLTHGSGAASYINVVGGSAALKLGLPVGKYFGRDSNPEPKISWFSDSPPDSAPLPWDKSGGMPVQMIGAVHAPVMRVDDDSTTDYAAFTMSNAMIATSVFQPLSDWKLDFRLTVDSYVPGEAVPAILPLIDLYFAGVLANIDEGALGKNVELHCSVDSLGNPYLNLVTFDAGANIIISIAQYVFVWNDGETHSFNIFTNKGVNQLFVCADGELLIPVAGTPAYSALMASAASSSVTFGSGGEPVSNVDMRTALSTVDWESVAVFRDDKVSDSYAEYNRYVGVYRGGDPTLLRSWNVAQVDWYSYHTYRIVRDPMSFVAVYLDGADVPILSISYDPIRLPPCSSSFLNQITNSRPVIAWGAFDPTEISRTRWRYLNYSMGKITLTDRLVPSHHILNQANVMASPEHTRTGEKHGHFGFTVYSGGTPEDDFMANGDVPAYTILGERIPPIPMTQNLESRGGLVRSTEPAMDVSAYDFVNYRGFLGRFDDDEENVVSIADALNSTDTLNAVMAVANDAAAAYENHRVRHAVAANVHAVDDILNTIVSPSAIDLPSAIVRLTDVKAAFNNHVMDGWPAPPTYHWPGDPGDVLTSANPIDLDSCVVLCNEIVGKYASHLRQGFFHRVPAVVPYFDANLVTAPDATNALTCLTLLMHVEIPDVIRGIRKPFIDHVSSSSWHDRTTNYSITLNYPPTEDLAHVGYIVPLANHLKLLFNQHIAAPGVHTFDDVFNMVTMIDAHDVDSAVALANEIKAKYNLHMAGQHVHFTTGLDPFVYPAIPNLMQVALQLANDILAKYNAHIVSQKSHAEQDVGNLVKIAPASDGASLVELANALKKMFNLHRTSISRDSRVHVRNDTINVVMQADATDLDSAIDLIDAVKTEYESHRVQDGVHGSAAFIRLEAPDRVLYEGMKFWTEGDGGAENQVSPFSDDETWHIDAIRRQFDKSLAYDGAFLPEQATVITVDAQFADIVDGDTLALEIDHLPSVTVVFQAMDTTLLDVINRINSFIPGCASAEGAELRLSSQAPSPSSSVIVNGGTALLKLGLSMPRFSPWFVISENPSDVSIALMSFGGDDFLEYGVGGPSTTVYSSRAGYTLEPSTGFDLNVRIRINSFLGGDDSKIYVGLTWPTYTIAIGWGGSGTGKFVKLQDMNTGKILDKIPFDWFDGNFHTYGLTYDETTQTLRLSIDV